MARVLSCNQGRFQMVTLTQSPEKGDWVSQVDTRDKRNSKCKYPVAET